MSWYGLTSVLYSTSLTAFLLKFTWENLSWNIEARLSQQGLDLDGYLNMLSMKKEDFVSKLEADCKKNLTYMFTLLAIAKEEKLEVNEEDFNKAYETMAAQYGMSVEDVKKALSNRIEALGNDLLNQKVVEFLKKENNI